MPKETKKNLMTFCICVMAICAMAETEGWTDIGSTRMIVPPTDVLWTAPASIADFRVEKRGGAEGTVEIVGQMLRISKTNGSGTLLVIARRPFAVTVGRKLRASVEVSVPMAVPECSQGFIRMYGRRENLDFHPLDSRAFMRGGVRMTNLYCTAEGVWERKFAHCEATAEEGTNVTCTLVVSGAPSVSMWREWCVEDADAAQGRWREYMAAHPPIDFAADRIPRAEFRARLEADTEHTATVRNIGGVPRLFVDGVETPPVIYKGKLPRPWETNIFTFAGRRLEREGVRLQTVTIRFGRTAGRAGFWTQDCFDAEGAAEYLEETMRAAPESLFIPTFHLDAYPEFSAEHPDEVWRSANGLPVFGNGGQAEKVTAHDPALEGRWPWISYHSISWREAVKTNLTALVAAFRRRGLTKRIVGVHIAGYHDGQFATQVADFSPCALRAFAEATGRPVVAPRFGTEEWLVPGRDDAAIAYLVFLKDQPLHLQEGFVRYLRSLFGKPVVSAIWCMSAYSGTMGHAYFTTAFLDSPEIDILVSQQEYGYRAPGVPLGTKLPFASFRRHGKLYVNEFDYRTWGAFEMWTDSEMSSIGLGRVLDKPAWETVHRRAAGQMFAERAGFWYYDMGGGWFAPTEIAQDIGDVRRAESSLHTAHPSGWRPSAAFVIDEKGLLLANQPCGLYEERQRSLVRRQIQHLASASVPYDTWLIEDFLRAPELGEVYRIVVFAGMHAVDVRRRKLLERMAKDGRILVFLAGTGSADGTSVEGITVSEPNGFTAAMFHDAVRTAGGYVPVDHPGLQVCMNGDFVCIHCLVPGRYLFRLPVFGNWENMKTGRVHLAVKELPFDLIAGETRWYRRR